MTLEDFCKFYVTLDICSMTPDFLEGSSFGQWKTSFYEGRWVAGTTAGGCTNYPSTNLHLYKYAFSNNLFIFLLNAQKSCHGVTKLAFSRSTSLFFPKETSECLFTTENIKITFTAHFIHFHILT